MAIDSGNLSAVAQVKSKEGGQDLEVDLEESRPNVDEEQIQSGAPYTEETYDDVDNKLPFSVARSIFFVLSLTGAAFLNVCIIK
jgi:hypothetical protein